ncbi:3-hydroxyacyl-CoA dehydrogenase NAD-binding domain-containing protein [Bosea sp. BIWAKO-01]|uniref:3-hydroxyacyl-CoA dehydrogenase NAD-binding domain-containing protein n=1 Tax=Bosea sp. BIWAKO-01 TaxID=506668 RepID=UPI0008536F10|nr:3-hydroxyacyl-CoA dehydrogenase NAD-binding domain-containing protein [Bosea sp. BIWAKO-01]GAU86940.1 enoyl-CoA hydratase [Bosea sp. BIWAKO-01]
MTSPSLVRTALDGTVAVLTIGNPPVNSLSSAVRRDLTVALSRAVINGASGVVLIGDGGHFSAGADIQEFDNGLDPTAPDPNDLHAAIEASPVPVVAAIRGTALGGGLELALACHGRVATPQARIGLPEVKLGLLPGGGGTQRLPRVAKAVVAAGMIASGRILGAADAQAAGIIDRIGDAPVAEAMILIEKLGSAPLTAASSRALPPDFAEAIDAARAGISAKSPHAEASRTALDAVAQAARLSFPEALAEERRLFLSLMETTTSRALRHLFFAERAAAGTPGIGKDTQTRPVETVGVIGAGTMGSGIAMVFANTGLPVTLIERDAAGLERGLKLIRDVYDRAVAKGDLTTETAQGRLQQITGKTEIATLSGADLVIEAAFEEMQVKLAIFAELDKVAKRGAILATNTSALDVDVIAAATSRPADVVGLHFFSPAHVMRLLEIVRARQTAPDVLATVIRLARKTGKTPVVVGVCDGFLANRLLYPYLRQADLMLEEGALPEQIDGALNAFGLAMGPCAMLDMAGQDVAWHVRQRQLKDWDPERRYSRLADLLVEQGRLGSKTGAGWYRYSGRQKEADPTVEAMILQESDRLGISRRAISDEEIVKRALYAIVNEGAFALADGTVQRASDIDVAYTQGMGFPAARGGPMFWADTVGLAPIYADILSFGADGDANWRPAPLLKELAEGGRSFADHDRERRAEAA